MSDITVNLGFLILMPVIIIVIGLFLAEQCGSVIAGLLIVVGLLINFGLFCTGE